LVITPPQFAGSASTAQRCWLSLPLRTKGLDFLVEIPRDLECLGIPIGSQKTGHPVIGNVNAITAFVDEHRDRGIRAGVRNVPCHLLHDERIAQDEPHHSGVIAIRRFPYNGAVVQFHEEHQARLAQPFANYAFEIWKHRRSGCPFRERYHVRMAYGGSNRG